MYRVRRWNNDRDEMTEELVEVLVLDSIAMGLRFGDVGPLRNKRQSGRGHPCTAGGPRRHSDIHGADITTAA